MNTQNEAQAYIKSVSKGDVGNIKHELHYQNVL